MKTAPMDPGSLTRSVGSAEDGEAAGSWNLGRTAGRIRGQDFRTAASRRRTVVFGGAFRHVPAPERRGRLWRGRGNADGAERHLRRALRIRSRERRQGTLRPTGHAASTRHRTTFDRRFFDAASEGSPARSGSSPRPDGPSPSMPFWEATPGAACWCPGSTPCSAPLPMSAPPIAASSGSAAWN